MVIVASHQNPGGFQSAGPFDVWNAAFLTPLTFPSWQGVAAHVDTCQSETEYILRLDLPGFSAEEVNIEVLDNKLTISAARAEHSNEKASRSVAFSRAFPVPANVKQDDISASLDKGVLTVTLPKAEPTPKPEPKTVLVRAGTPPSTEAGGAEAEGGEGQAATGKSSGQCRGWGRCSKCA